MGTIHALLSNLLARALTAEKQTMHQKMFMHLLFDLDGAVGQLPCSDDPDHCVVAFFVFGFL